MRFYIGAAGLITLAFWTWANVIWAIERATPELPPRFMEVDTAIVAWLLTILFIWSAVAISSWMTKP